MSKLHEQFMIGDWIGVNGFNHKVEEIAYKDGELTIGILDPQCEIYSCYKGLDKIESIPLTAEILEKNGFCLEEEERGFSEPYQVYVNDEYQYVIKIYPKDGMDRYSKLIIGEYDDSENMSLLINYVHELQHALKLCGIEKEIQI